MAIIDLQFNYPILPGQDVTFAEVLSTVAREPEAMKLPPYGGVAEHREAATEWISAGVDKIAPERVLLSAGGHHAVIATMLALELPGKKIACDPLTYNGFVAQAQTLGCPLVPCEGDDEGMLPDALDRAARERGVAAVFLMPTNQNPVGTVMPLQRRKDIVEVARKHGLYLIDDDAYRFTVADAAPHFASLAPELAFFVYSFTKPFAPAMKVAFLAFPEKFSERLVKCLRITASGAPRVFSAATVLLIKSGKMASIIEAKQKEGASRQKLARKILAGLPMRSYDGSFHVWLDFPDTLPSERLTSQLADDGVAVSAAVSCLASPEVRANGIRVALGAEQDLSVLRTGLERVRDKLAAGTRAKALS